jgi:hypothetical protein
MADSKYPKIVENETGPNGHPVGYDANGDYVEWIPDDDEMNDGKPWAMIMRRNDKAISEEYRRLWDKVWWNRHMSRCPTGDPNKCPREQPGCDPARALVDRYGLKFLGPGDQVEWGITQGKMMALAWVHGSDWEDSGST